MTIMNRFPMIWRSNFFCLVLGGLSFIGAGFFPVSASMAATSAPNTSGVLPLHENRDHCGQPQRCFAEALHDLKQGKSEQAQEKLLVLRERFKEVSWGARAAFVLGKLALQAQSDDAIESFRQAMDLNVVKDHVLFYQAEAYRQKNEWLQAVSFYDQLLEDYPDSTRRPAGFYQRAITLVAAGDCNSARRSFEKFLANYPNDPERPSALNHLAQCLLKLDKREQAIKVLRRIWIHHPLHPAAPKAQETLSLLQVDMPVSEPTAEERYHRAKKLFKAARYEEAKGEFLMLSEDSKSPYHDRAALKLAITQIRLKQYRESKQTLEKLIARSTSSKRLQESMHWLARVAVRLQDKTLLFDIEKRLAQEFPGSHQHCHVLILVGGVYEDEGQPDQALQVYKKVLKKFRRDPLVKKAVWRIGWIAYQSGQYEKATKVFSSYADYKIKGSDRRRFLYWMGRSVENLGQVAQARDIYENVCQTLRRTYYCQMARERLEKLDPVLQTTAQVDDSPLPLSRSVAVEPVLPSTKSSSPHFFDPHYRAAKELMIIGFYQEAAGELDLLTRRYAADRGVLLDLADLLYRAGDYHRSLRILRMYFSDVLEHGSETVPVTFWRQAFPLEIIELIRKQSPPGAADPYVVAAIMREESAFDAKAISSVGALGLMQIMPLTGEWVSRQLGHRSFKSTDLMDPQLNIRLGSWYLGYLAQQFKGNLILTVASYNAGPEAVTRWTRMGLPQAETLDEFIESIPFSETRAFTKRVVRTYTEYLHMAGLDPAQRFTRSILMP